MPIVMIENAGSAGMVTDLPAHDLPPEAWTDALNVRFQNQVAEKFLGHSVGFSTPAIPPQHAMFAVLSGSPVWFYANGVAIHMTDGTTDSDVTRTAGAYHGGAYSQWNGGVIGGVPILNNNALLDYPQQWDTSTNKMKDLDNWPTGVYAKVIRPFKQFLIALNIIKGGVELPYTIKTSHPADPGTVPISWDETDATKDTIERPLSETVDEIVDGLTLGDIFVIYKEKTTWGMQYIGGQSVFRTWKLFTEFGMLAQNCAANTPLGQVVVSRGDVILHNGNSFQSIIDRQNREALFDAISDEFSSHTFVTLDKKYNELWICFAEQGAATPYATRAFVWNWQSRTWTQRELPSLGFAISGLIPEPGVSYTFDSSSGSFDTDIGSFNQILNPTAQDQILMCGAADTLFYVADRTSQFNGSNFSSYLERRGLGIVGRDRAGNWRIDLQSVKFLRNVYPKISGTFGTSFTVHIGSQMGLNDDITWHGPFTFDPATDAKIDCTISARVFSFRFESSTNTEWHLHGYGLDLDIIARF